MNRYFKELLQTSCNNVNNKKLRSQVFKEKVCDIRDQQQILNIFQMRPKSKVFLPITSSEAQKHRHSYILWVVWPWKKLSSLKKQKKHSSFNLYFPLLFIIIHGWLNNIQPTIPFVNYFNLF